MNQRMTNPFQTIIEQADAATAEFVRVEAEARAEYDRTNEYLFRESVSSKRDAQVFLESMIRDVDKPVVQKVFTQTYHDSHLHQQIEEATNGRFWPSTATPRWELNSTTYLQIERDVVRACDGVYNALSRFRNAELRRKFVHRFAIAFALISVVGATLLNHHLQEVQRQQKYVDEIRSILGDSEIIATDGYRNIFRIRSENISSWLKEPALDSHQCSNVLPFDKQDMVVCSGGSLWSVFDLRTGKMQRQPNTLPNDIWRLFDVSKDGQSYSYSRYGSYPVLHRSGEDFTFDVQLIDFAFSPDNTQYAYSTENTIFWFKHDLLLGIYSCEEFCLVRFSPDSKQLIQYNRRKLVFMAFRNGQIEANQSVELETRYDPIAILGEDELL
jgi:hypothetical protein